MSNGIFRPDLNRFHVVSQYIYHIYHAHSETYGDVQVKFDDRAFLFARSGREICLFQVARVRPWEIHGNLGRADHSHRSVDLEIRISSTLWS